MRLAEFIGANTERLVEEWESFARSVQPLPAILTDEELRDWAQQTLEAVSEDIEIPQTDEDELLRSRGFRAGHERLVAAGSEHAAQRLMQGFLLDQVYSEFRALRANVIRSWLQETTEADREVLAQLFRFDQALDEVLAESMKAYTKRLERSRHLVLGALGHDLRNPLSAINSGIEYLLMSGENLTHDQTKVVLRMRNSVGRIRKMIEDLLDFTRTRLGGSLPISPDSMDLEDTLRQVVDELRAYHPGREVNVQASGDLVGSWDRGRIEQLTSNLISNALKHGRTGSPVAVVARDEGQEVALSVHNEGEPISRETRRSMFDPLMRGGAEARERRSKADSVGLGLYIANQIVETHGGRIEVESSREAGTTFEVWLPRQRLSQPSTEGPDT